jgi:pyridoxamine 5'-phosphate oxidase
MIETLDAALADAEARLIRAAKDRTSPMHMPVIGTADGDLRMMTLRDCAPGPGLLRLHTDARSPKAALIGAGAQVSLLAFDPLDKVQLRLRGTGRIETAGPIADAAWAEASPYARRCYLAEAAPGALVDGPTSGLPAEVEGIRPSEAQLMPARANFVVLLIEPNLIDWLHLAHTGHRRARFERSGDGWSGDWVVP